MKMKKSAEKAYRVLMVTGIYPTEERPHAGTFIKSQVDSLLEAGLEVEIIHPKPGPVLIRYATAAIQVFLKTWQGNFDVVHGHYGLWILAGCIQWTTPVVASFLGDDLLGTPTGNSSLSKKSKLVVHISRWLCRRVKAVIVKSEEMKKAARMEKGIFVIPNGVDFALFRPIPRSEARAALGWKQDAYYVLFGNDPQIPRKNFALAQAAIECLRARGICAELVVAKGLPQTRVVQYINACNALILPSLIEGSPNIVKETMACNVPVVATNVGDVSRVIGHTKGCNVCPFEAEALAAALEEAIRHREPTTGRSDIQHLDRRAVAQQVIELYKWAISAKHSRGNGLPLP
jgi:teichuronic acid biosynthesis glycosyltransferase TuaC